MAPFGFLNIFLCALLVRRVPHFLLCIFFGPWMIDLLHRLKIGQHVRDDEVLKRHRKKEGTPTMGGVMFIGAVFIATALWAETKNLYTYGSRSPL